MTDHEPTKETTQSHPTDDTKQAMLDELGGTWGMVYMVIPVALFATVVAFVSLPITVGISIAVALALAAFRMMRASACARRCLFGIAAAGYFVVAFLLVAFVVLRALPSMLARWQDKKKSRRKSSEKEKQTKRQRARGGEGSRAKRAALPSECGRQRTHAARRRNYDTRRR